MGDPFADFPPHFISLETITGTQLEQLFELADRIRDRELDWCERRRLALVFEKPSTRTRVSFEVGIRQLDGSAVYLGRDDIQLARGETIPDTSRTLSRYVDGIVCRTFEHERVEQLAEYAAVPVINALTDWAHPCQALADFYTIRRLSEKTSPTLTYVGDGNNVCHSLMVGAFLRGLPMRISGPEGYEPDPVLLESLKDRGGAIEFTSDPAAAVKGTDFVYTDVWTSMGDEEEAEQRRRAFQPYQINRRLLEGASPEVRVMHCLPAHRGEEITDEVMEGSASVVFDQAENRLHVQKALMAVLLGDPEAVSETMA